MFDRKFIHSIQTLKAIKPSSEWKTRTKDVLLSQIRSQGSHEVAVPFSQRTFVYCTEGLRIAYHATFGVVFARPAHLAAALSLVIGIGSAMVFIAERSLPGDPLYAVKQTTEEVGMAFVSPDGRAEAELERTMRRLAELRALAHAPLSDEEKEHHVEAVVDTLSGTLSTVRQSLDTISEPSKALSAAHAIKEKTATVRQELGELDVSEKTESKLADVQAAVRQTDQKALEVIVDRGGSAGLTDAAIATQLTEETRTLTNKLNNLEMKVTIATAGKPDNHEELLKKKNEAQQRLAEVSEQIEKKDFKLALEKLNQSKELAADLERRLKDTAVGSAPADGGRK